MTDNRERPSLLIFAGTTEGRLLAQYASEKKIPCYVSTATEYGKSILEGIENIEKISGRMDEGEIRRFIEEKKIRLVIDATHPFAVAATENIRQACAETGAGYVRCLRQEEFGAERESADAEEADGVMEKESTGADAEENAYRVRKERIKVVASVKEAADFLKNTGGNILIATGSKELKYYTEIPDYRERCYARVLSTPAAVQESAALGFEGRHLIAMQGPFSAEMNLALLHQTDARYFVTKESGKAGGFEEKAEAAEQTGAVLVVVGRPEEEGEDIGTVKKILDKFENLNQNL